MISSSLSWSAWTIVKEYQLTKLQPVWVAFNTVYKNFKMIRILISAWTIIGVVNRQIDTTCLSGIKYTLFIKIWKWLRILISFQSSATIRVLPSLLRTHLRIHLQIRLGTRIQIRIPLDRRPLSRTSKSPEASRQRKRPKSSRAGGRCYEF
jgi:hypothetical protein